MTWFEKLVGVVERSPEEVRRQVVVEGSVLTSRANGCRYLCGVLETPSLDELRQRIAGLSAPTAIGPISLEEIVGDVRAMHTDPANAGALFQVASQFNLLEMTSPNVTPEMGITRYENDRTQGPACAIACGAGTIYRNYFVPLGGSQIGQSAALQIDCLADLGAELGNSNGRFWTMKNGYALASSDGLRAIAQVLESASEPERDRLRGLLRVGAQSRVEVTLNDCDHLVTQVYCSALPVAYCRHPTDVWAPFARLVLEAAYEATLAAAVLNADETGQKAVFLTLLGGGAFGNETRWIIESLARALRLYRDRPLNVGIVSYSSSQACVREMIRSFNR